MDSHPSSVESTRHGAITAQTPSMNLSTVFSRGLIFGALFSAPAFQHCLAASRQISAFAGIGVAGYSGDGGAATNAQLNNPYGIARGPDGALYICDMANHRIRKVSRQGTITSAAGTGKRGHSGDGGPAQQAE